MSPRPPSDRATERDSDQTRVDWDALERAALAARERAYCPYSQFAVGAALLTRCGEIVSGANIENRSYPATLCAERSAVATANDRGLRDFVALVVAADNQPPARPCGVCLQVLSEFAERMPIRLINPAGDREQFDLADLLPHPFRFTDEEAQSASASGTGEGSAARASSTDS